MSNTKRADVALLRCEDYEDRKLDAIIAQAAEIAGFPDVRGATVLLKPNVLNASPATKAVTTHPSFVGAVIKFVRARGAKEVLVGDSPGWQPGTLAAKVCGIYESVQKHGGVWVDFGEASLFPITNGKKLKNLPLTTALRRADFVVNLPKLKNHHLMTYTGAMKNLFGLIPGTAKSAMHLQYPNVADFGQMLVDLALSVPRCFTFMDGIVAMQGEGPGAGTPYPLGIVLASQSVAMLDWVATRCIGYDPSRIPYVLDGMQRTVGSESFAEPATYPLIVSEIGHEGFELLPYGKSKVGQRLISIPDSLRALAGSFIRMRPIFHTKKCIGCGACIEICPADALCLTKRSGSNIIHIDDGRCITCFCCHEVCPAGAISVGRAPFRFVHSKMRHTYPQGRVPRP
ncbi:MAG TPA: FeS-binding protein [Spirochaetaceae bacterium]|nr:FeS-binding protein [Spirochaetaceae bacterium]